MKFRSLLAVALVVSGFSLVAGCIIPPDEVTGPCLSQCSAVGCPCSFCAVDGGSEEGVCQANGFCKVYPSDWEGLSACGATGGTAGSAGSTSSSGGAGGQGGTAGSAGSTSSGGTAGQGGSINCGPGTKDCGGSCVVASDPSYGCDDATCAPCDIANAVPECVNSSCGISSCASGFEDCNISASDGCETNLMNDVANCGSCGTACLANQPCDQGKCLPLCGNKALPATGRAACWRLTSNTLGVGTYGTITVSLNAPAAGDPGDQITPGCVSSVAATQDDSTDPSVLCPLPAGAAAGDHVYFALKAYSSNVGNPPVPFSAFRCDPDTAVNGKCVGILEIYKDGVLEDTFVNPPMAPFAYWDTNVGKPMQVDLTVQ